MTICRTTEFGGTPGASARPADMTRIGSLPGGARTATMPPRQGARGPAVRRPQPPDYELLVRVRDGLMRL
jgi:hypothetical protein